MSGANGATEFKDVVGTLDELRALMGEPSEIALRKDIGRLDEHCRAFIARAPFLLVATADRAGRCDVSPKGDAPGFVLVVDDRTLVIGISQSGETADTLAALVHELDMGPAVLAGGSGGSRVSLLAAARHPGPENMNRSTKCSASEP